MKFVPPAILGMLDQVTDQLNIETIKKMGFAATNLKEDYSPVAAED